jgi:hypothetical protein
MNGRSTQLQSFALAHTHLGQRTNRPFRFLAVGFGAYFTTAGVIVLHFELELKQSKDLVPSLWI